MRRLSLWQVTLQDEILPEDAAAAHALGVVLHRKWEAANSVTLWLENVQGDVLYRIPTEPRGPEADPQDGIRAAKVCCLFHRSLG